MEKYIYEVWTNYVTLSSTINATGVYDIAGCRKERVASYVHITKKFDSWLTYMKEYGGGNEGDIFDNTTKSTKYRTIYLDEIGDVSASDECLKCFKGDALSETSLSNTYGWCWYSKSAGILQYTSPFINRGGSTNYRGCSAFSYNNDSRKSVRGRRVQSCVGYRRVILRTMLTNRKSKIKQ